MLDSTVPYCSWVYASAGMETTTNRSRVAKDALISSVALGTSQMFFRNSKYGATESAKSGGANAHPRRCVDPRIAAARCARLGRGSGRRRLRDERVRRLRRRRRRGRCTAPVAVHARARMRDTRRGPR